MTAPDLRPLSLATLIIAGLEIGLPWAVGGKSPMGQAILVSTVALAGVIPLFLAGPRPGLRPSPVSLAAALLAGISAFHTIHPDRTVQTLLLLLSYFLAATLACHAGRQSSWARLVLLASISTAGALVSLVGAFDIFSRHEGGLYAGLLTGPFGYPNAAGGFLVLTAGASLATAREHGGIASRGSALVAALLAILGLVLTRSQGATLAAAIGLAVWVVMVRRTWWSQRHRWAAVGCVGLLLAVAFAPNRLYGLPLRLWSLFGAGPVDPSYAWRLHIWEWTLAMVRDHPWWGVGPGAFPVALLHYQQIPYVSGQNPHNLFLEVAAEYGLPAGLLVVLGLGLFLARAAAAIRQAPEKDPARGRLAILLAALVAFVVHSLVDLDWSFPAIALTAATLIGLASAHLPQRVQQEKPLRPLWRGSALLLLLGVALLSLSRYYASILVDWSQMALASRDGALAAQELSWALRLNPMSFRAHQSSAWARLRSGNAAEAVEVAERAARLAPLDPNGQFLAGETAASAGRRDLAEARFQAAVDRAPSAQLRFHAALVESAASLRKAAEARFRYERAVEIFTPERVLSDAARCLAPGDRYLYARMNRRAGRLYADAQDTPRQHAAEERARTLEQPDPRGICATSGRPAQTSPEVSVDNFWRAFREGGWSHAERFLASSLRESSAGENGRTARWNALAGQAISLARIDSLSGGERTVRLRYEIEVRTPPGEPKRHCASTDLQLTRDGWSLERLPALDTGPCPQTE